jgi:hypothetical protein
LQAAAPEENTEALAVLVVISADLPLFLQEVILLLLVTEDLILETEDTAKTETTDKILYWPN